MIEQYKVGDKITINIYKGNILHKIFLPLFRILLILSTIGINVHLLKNNWVVNVIIFLIVLGTIITKSVCKEITKAQALKIIKEFKES